MSPIPLDIEARVRDGERMRKVRGQHNTATATGTVEHVELIPNDPPAQPEALEAISGADWAVLGPGSWYTSIIPHLLIPDTVDALEKTKAKKILSLNLLAEKETRGMTASDHIRSFHEHAPGLHLDVVLADPSAVDDIQETQKAARECGAHLLMRQVRMGDGSARHDTLRLGAAYRDAFEGILGDVAGSGERRD